MCIEWVVVMKVCEIFYSLQGEGGWVGVPMVFVRLVGCNLRCSFCDTRYAYVGGVEMSVSEILNKVKGYPCRWVCVTGGEPLVQKETISLVKTLVGTKYRVCLETNGSLDISSLLRLQNVFVSMDVKCPSSGMMDQMKFTNIKKLRGKDQLKFVIGDRKDYMYAKEVVERYPCRCPMFFQPVWRTDPRKLALWILTDGLNVRLSLQFHKIIWGEQRGT